jgi:hypothetical protein
MAYIRHEKQGLREGSLKAGYREGAGFGVEEDGGSMFLRNVGTDHGSKTQNLNMITVTMRT